MTIFLTNLHQRKRGAKRQILVQVRASFLAGETSVTVDVTFKVDGTGRPGKTLTLTPAQPRGVSCTDADDLTGPHKVQAIASVGGVEKARTLEVILDFDQDVDPPAAKDPGPC
jgi:hypothetical protein